MTERIPTSHEARSGQSWDESYQDGPAPWDIGVPQPAIVRLAFKNAFTGSVLDAGCGPGENALHIASRGSKVLGCDVAETAIEIARTRARDRGLDVEFIVADALQLQRLGRTFDSVIDCGLFHSLDNDEQRLYASSLANVTNRYATLYVLCFSDEGVDLGPHPVRRDELRAAFDAGSGWSIASIEPERLETRFHEHGVSAWLVTVKRV